MPQETLFLDDRSLKRAWVIGLKLAWLLRVFYVFVILITFSAVTLSAAQPHAAQEICNSPLITAIHERDTAQAIKLINSGVDLNARTCGALGGTTALVEAIVSNETEVIERLVSKGADVNEIAGRNEPPLIIASFYCRQEVMPLLLAHGANVNAIDLDGYSALMQSTQNCPDGSTAALLLRVGAKVNLRAKNGHTALTTAAFYGNEDAVHVLVAAGADLTAKNGDGGTALTMARDREVGRKESHDRIYHFLLQVSRLEEARTGNS